MAQFRCESSSLDPFETLGLPRDATIENIRTKYHKLARRYHPNRSRGSDDTKVELIEHFHRIRDAWEQLKDTANRRRCIEVLKLLDLQNEMHLHFADIASEEHREQSRPDLTDGHISSEASEEDLPTLGLHRRQTVLKRNSPRHRNMKHLTNDLEKEQVPVLRSPTRKSVRIQDTKSADQFSPPSDGPGQSADYFTERRRKMKKLRIKEYEAFTAYRDAKLAMLEAEKNMEEKEQAYENARFKREYFDNTPKETAERLRSFIGKMGAVRAFGSMKPRKKSLPDVTYGIMSPVAGPSPTNQFLSPDHVLQRKKSAHRRGYSSDISGDQDSSDEESSGSHGTVRGLSPPGHWTSINNFSRPKGSVAVLRSENGWTSREGPEIVRQMRNQDRLDSPGGFKFLLRPPTGFTGTIEDQDSGRDGTSRSPSPQLAGFEYRNLDFQILATPDILDLFGISKHRSRSPGSAYDGHFSSHHGSGNESHLEKFDEFQFQFRPQTLPQHHHIPIDHVHLLSKPDEYRLLGAEPDSEADPAMLLARLRQLDPTVADKFVVKRDIKEQFNFRLIFGHRPTTSHQRESFIALSYRRRLLVQKHSTHYTLPLDAEMFQAVWDERQSDREGIWIDQICIDQESESERTISMSAMDTVYRSARLIVVALDDILLESHEGERLQHHIKDYESMYHVAPRQRFRRKQPPWLESNEDLLVVIRKLLRSSWFVRAWCRHEMRLAKKHIFLVPCKRLGTSQAMDVLRFSGKCMAHLLALATEVPFEPEIEMIKPALHAFFSDRSKMAADETHLSKHHGNFTTVVAEVFAMQAGGDPRIALSQRQSDARKDKISIILNTMECGLALHQDIRQPNTHISDEECFHHLLLLALAAQDPGALCSVGAPLPISTQATSWISAPTVADSGLNNYKTLQRLPGNARFRTSTCDAEHFIQLDLKFLKPVTTISASPADVRTRPEIYWPSGDLERLELAKHFINVCETKKWGRNRKRYLLHDTRLGKIFGPIRDIYAETLASIFYCGPGWLDDVCKRYSMGRWKVELDGAWRLLVALKSTNGNWPDRAWSENAAGFIMDFVNFLIIRGLPQRQITTPEAWRPICVSTINGGKVLTFIPTEHKLVRTAVPKVLVHNDYVHLARMWILQPRNLDEQGGEDSDLLNCQEWTLLGKSVVFSDEKAVDQMESFSGDYRDQQRVFGRQRRQT